MFILMDKKVISNIFITHINVSKKVVIRASFACIILIIFITPSVNSEPRTYHRMNMCYPKQRVYNCSFQVLPALQNGCLIYNTDVCKKNEFPSWMLEPLLKPRYEPRTEFTVSIEPYAFYIEDLHKNKPVSAINISLTSFNKRISGFSIIMNRNIHPKNVCRIIDFRNSLGDIKIPFTFFYDCFVKLREDFWKDVMITFKAYPLNIELTYLVYIPRVSEVVSDSSCDWTPLVMLYHESLARNHIQLKFSNPQNDSNILFFVVNLLDPSGTEVDEIRIPANVKNDMVFCEYQSVENGYYSTSISLILPEKSCVVFQSGLFFVGVEIKDYTLIIFIVLLISMIILVFVLTYYFCQRYLTSAASTIKPNVLLVYFHKQLQHEFLVMWARYLEKHYGVNVYTLYKRGGNPKKWLVDVTSQSNIIVFVISKGLSQVFDGEMPSSEEDHYWVEHLPEAKALINNLKTGEKDFCKVCFPFSKKEHIPKCLRNKGPLYKLLGNVDETEKFLCYIFNCSSKLRLLNKLCCIKHHAIKNQDSMEKDLKALKDKLNKISENKYDFVFNSMNEENLQNVLNKQISLQKDCITDKTSDDDIVVNQDIKAANNSNFECKTYPQNSCKSDSDISDEEESSALCIDFEDSENKNTLFRQLSENDSFQTNEFLMYCLKKAINFER